MTRVNISLEVGDLSRDLQRYADNLEVAQERAVRDTMRRMQTIARREVRQLTHLRPRSVNRRVRTYRDRNNLFFGANPSIVTSYTPARVRLTRRRGNQPRGVILDGQRIEGAFVPTQGRLAGRAVRRTGVGRGIEPVRADNAAEMRRAYDIVLERLPEEYDRQFRAVVDRMAR